MRKINLFGKHTLLIFLVTALLAVGQAVFLLLNNSRDNALAQETGIVLNSNYYQDGVHLSWLIDSNLDVSRGYKLIVSTSPNPVYPGNSSDGVYYIEYPETMYYQWRSPMDSNTTYYFRVCQYEGNEACGIYSNTVAVTTMPETLTVNFLKPFKNELVSGAVNINAETNFPAESVNFTIISEHGNSYNLSGENVGNNLFAAAWDTDDSNIGAGDYTIRAFAYKASGWEATTETSVIINSELQPSLVPRIYNPASGDKVSGIVRILVSIDTNISYEKVYIKWPGTQAPRQEMVQNSNNEYHYEWNTGSGDWGDENYLLRAEAEAAGTIYPSADISVVVDNKSSDIEPPSEPSIEELRVEFISSSGTLGEATTLEASTNVAADVVFWIYQNTTYITEYTGVRTDNNTYSFSFDPSNLANDNYLIKAVASQSGYDSNYDTITITVNKPVEPAANQENTMEPQAETSEAYTINFIEESQEISASRVIKAETNFTPYTVKFLVSKKDSPAAPTGYSASRASDMKYYFWLDTSAMEPGEYIIKAVARKGDVDYEDSANIFYSPKIVDSGDDAALAENEESNLENNITEKQEPVEAERPESTPGEELNNKISEEEEKEEQVNEIIDNSLDEKAEETALIHEENIALEILPQCLEQGISTHDECQHWLSLPEPCRTQSIREEYRCQAYMNLPQACRENNITLEDCQSYLDLPFECRQRGIKSEEKCEIYLFNNAIPAPCQQAGIKNHAECSLYLMSLRMPRECQEKGFNTEEECAQFLDREETVEGSSITGKEGKAGEENNQRELFDPRCISIGISDIVRCDKYLEMREIAEECSLQGINAKSECEDYLLKRHSTARCLSAGISDEDECEAYIFNSSLDRVTCTSGDTWRCQNVIKNKYLGTIALKLSQFDEIKNEAASLGEETIKVSELEEKFIKTRAVLPLSNKEIKLKIIKAQERLIIGSENELSHVAPAALMFDSDSDGLSDDTEKRLGTNPDERDTDGDGYSDSDEIRAGYNPLGEGKIINKIAPIEEAILEGREIEHAKTDGKENDKFKVATVENIETDTDETAPEEGEEEKAGYAIAGTALPSSVVTLYIYSDLPIVTTVKTDSYGNWLYEFNHSLVDGEHEVYVAINDNTGRVINKSKPFGFFVKEARAVSASDYIAIASTKTAPQTESMIDIYLIIASVTIAVGLLLFVLFFLMQKRRQKPV